MHMSGATLSLAVAALTCVVFASRTLMHCVMTLLVCVRCLVGSFVDVQSMCLQSTGARAWFVSHVLALA